MIIDWLYNLGIRITLFIFWPFIVIFILCLLIIAFFIVWMTILFTDRLNISFKDADGKEKLNVRDWNVS